MSVRIIILLLALPLFLLLAAVNSLLLYREDTTELEAGLRAEALAAAVTVAEFAKASPDPHAGLSEPHRLAALRTVDKEIAGLEALYLVTPGKPPLNLLDRPLIAPRQGPPPARADVLGTREDGRGRRLITALAPVGQGMMVVADIDAEPLARRAFHLKRLSIALIAGSVILAVLLGLIIARRVIGEFRRTRAIIDARGERPQHGALAIREVRDLADAVHLIDTSVASELQRLGKSGEGNPAIGIAAARALHFPDVSIDHGGVALSIRLLPNASAGIFYVHKAGKDGVLFAIGEMDGEPPAALASAVALKNFVLAGPADAFMLRVSRAHQMFGAKKIATGEHFSGSGGPAITVLYGNAIAMRDYAGRNPNLDPDSLTADLAALFPDAGVIAVARKKAGRAEA